MLILAAKNRIKLSNNLVEGQNLLLNIFIMILLKDLMILGDEIVEK